MKHSPLPSSLKLSSLTFLFPAYNDALSIPELVAKVDKLGPQVANSYSIVVVNDGSYDDTQKVLTKLEQKYPHLRAIHHPHNQGYGGALTTGFTAATTEWLFYTDGDGQYDPDEIFLLLDELQKHPEADVINGYKKKRDDHVVRKLAGHLYNYLLHLFYPLPIRDTDCDFRLMKVKKLQELHLRSKSGLICVELISKFAQNKAIFFEVGIHHYARKYGQSQFFHVKHIWNTFIDHLWYFFSFHFGESAKPQNNRD